jgi:1,4-dihydroxy-2-naphthoate octaprenyltransferase
MGNLGAKISKANIPTLNLAPNLAMKTADENRTGSKLKAWLKVARLQFYPRSWIAYSLGAVCAGSLYGVFDIKPYLAGYLCLFLLELLTVLLNDYFDYETDKLNQNGSLYSGGSRAIVEFYLSFSEVKVGIVCIPHALILLKAIAKVRSQQLFDCRIDGVMQMALSYIIWFGFIPLLVLFMNLNI